MLLAYLLNLPRRLLLHDDVISGDLGGSIQRTECRSLNYSISFPGQFEAHNAILLLEEMDAIVGDVHFGFPFGPEP